MFNKNRQNLFLPLACWGGFLLLTLCVNGCSKPSQRQSLEGSVKLNGKPLANGYIMFFGDTKSAGPSVGGPIEEGRFSISAEHGAFASAFRVEITASGSSGRKVKDPDSGQTVDEMVEMIPSQYNSKSKLTADVHPNEINKFDFDLKSK